MHSKHHAVYVAGVNGALSKHPEFSKLDIVAVLKQTKDMPSDIKTAARNHGGQHPRPRQPVSMLCTAGHADAADTGVGPVDEAAVALLSLIYDPSVRRRHVLDMQDVDARLSGDTVRRRRSLQPHDVLEDHGQGDGQQRAVRRAEVRHR